MIISGTIRSTTHPLALAYVDWKLLLGSYLTKPAPQRLLSRSSLSRLATFSNSYICLVAHSLNACLSAGGRNNLASRRRLLPSESQHENTHR